MRLVRETVSFIGVPRVLTGADFETRQPAHFLLSKNSLLKALLPVLMIIARSFSYGQTLGCNPGVRGLNRT